jgi:hypothetical protein
MVMVEEREMTVYTSRTTASLPESECEMILIPIQSTGSTRSPASLFSSGGHCWWGIRELVNLSHQPGAVSSSTLIGSFAIKTALDPGSFADRLHPTCSRGKLDACRTLVKQTGYPTLHQGLIPIQHSFNCQLLKLATTANIRKSEN